MKEPIYLDNHTAAKPSFAAVEAMLPFFKDYWGSPSALHQKGQELFGPIDQATSRIYEAIGANFEDSFTLFGSGADAIFQVFFSTYTDTTRETGKNHFLTPASEDPAILHPLQKMDKLDCVHKLLPVDLCGRVRPEILEEAIKPRVCLLSLSWANRLTGVIQPVADLARICRDKGIRFHVDASAVIGKLFFRFEDAGIDYLTFDGTLFHAPKGVGALFCRKGCTLSESSHLDVGALAALSVAMQEAVANFDTLCTETSRLRDQFESSISKTVPDAHIFFQEAERLPNTSVIAFPGAHRESLLYILNRRGVYASTQMLEPVLTACGIDPDLAACAVSFSLSYQTQEEEIERAAAIIAEAVLHLRNLKGEIV